MTVKILSQTQKDSILFLYREKKQNQKQLATVHKVSQRTIHRVLVEAGLATPVARIKGEAYQAMQLLKKYALSVEDLAQLLASVKMQGLLQATQANASKKSPTGHNGKQCLLTLPIPLETA